MHHQDQSFSNERIDLVDKIFHNCTFRQRELVREMRTAAPTTLDHSLR